MSDGARQRWEERWAARGVPGRPSPSVLGLAAELPARGRALDVAGGAGRHALWLAARGLEVTLVDISPTALAVAKAARPDLTTLALDLDTDPLPAGPWDLILVSHFLDRAVYRALPALLAPGGVLAIVHMTKTNLEWHRTPSAEWLLEPGELGAMFPGLEVIRSTEAWSPEAQHEATLVARRPA